jgi:predicted aspartyl protease
MDFYFEEDKPYVNVKINGKEIPPALVDTGSSFTGLPSKLCKELGLKGTGVRKFGGLCAGEKGIDLPMYSCKIEFLGKTFDSCVVGIPDTLIPLFGRNDLSNLRINLDWKERKINAEDC